jgi:hypothetical protein
MKISYKPTSAEVRKKRKAEYLSKYPIEIQLEAITEAAQGRPEKLNELLQGLAEIRGALPYAEEGNK